MAISTIGHSVKTLRQKFAASMGLPLAPLLPAPLIESAVAAEGVSYRRCVLDPVVTLWAFLSQVLDADRSCRKALSRLWSYLSDRPAPIDPASVADSGAYCKARQRLSEGLCHRLYGQVADALEAEVPPARRWWGRPVYLADGTTLSMPDTPANQAVYPQHPDQAQGCGFPMTKVVALFSLASGAVHAAVNTVWSAYEPPLVRALAQTLTQGALVIGERGFGTYANIALVCQQGLLVVFRLHQARPVDWRKGQRLGKDDRLVEWTKPGPNRKELTPADYAQLPEMMVVRLIRYRVPHKGFRSKQVILVTSLLDPIRYPKHELAALYGRRWQIEIDLRHVKASMDMDMLRTKSLAMIRKEIALYFLAYNLIRTLMAQAGHTYGYEPVRLSFKAALQHFNTWLPLLALATPPHRAQYFDTLLRLIVRERLPDRPGRVEPRVVKRRPKCSRWMQEPRAVLKQKLIA